MKTKIVSKRDLYLKRGFEYKIHEDKFDFNYNEVVLVGHNKPPLGYHTEHFVKVRAGKLIDSSWTCPICDKYSRIKIRKDIKERLYELLSEFDFIINKDYSKRNSKIKFDYMIETSKRKIYIKYFSSEYYSNVKDEKPYIQKVRDYCNEHHMIYLELNHLNYERKIEELYELVKKYN